jgi:hypothetical protein
LVVTDGGSAQRFVENLRGFRHFTVLEVDSPGVLAQTKRSLQGALQLGRRYILYTESTESDKQLFFEHDLGEFLPFPVCTPVQEVFSRDPATGALRCEDLVENRGLYYGADLSREDNDALIYWL